MVDWYASPHDVLTSIVTERPDMTADAVTVAQEDDGSGYEVLYIHTPARKTIRLSVDTSYLED